MLTGMIFDRLISIGCIAAIVDCVCNRIDNIMRTDAIDKKLFVDTIIGMAGLGLRDILCLGFIEVFILTSKCIVLYFYWNFDLTWIRDSGDR